MKRFIILLVLLLVFGSVGTWLRYGRVEPDRGPDFAAIPMSVDNWRGTELRFGEYAYDVLAADTTTLRRYVNDVGDEVWLFIGYFSSQKYGGQIHSPRHCLPGAGWSITRHEHTVFPPVAGAPEVKVNEMTIVKPSEREFMWYWFETRGGSVDGEYELKFDLVVNSLKLKPTDAAFIRLTVNPADGSAESARALVENFVSTLRPDLVKALPFSPRV